VNPYVSKGVPRLCLDHFIVFLGLILRFIVSKEGKIPNLKKVQAIMNILVFTNPQQIQVFNGMAQFYRCFIKNFVFYHGPNYKVDEEDKTFYLDHIMSRSLGSYQAEIHRNTNFDTFKLTVGVSCA
jgi:hypothetical protein